jgi:hypothetical protein
MIGRKHLDGTPLLDGVYAAEVYFGWKLLEWKDGAWWHLALVGRWMASDPVQWVGPLPGLMGQKGAETPKMEFDL